MMPGVISYNTRLWKRNADGTGLVFVHRRGRPQFLHLNQEGLQVFQNVQGKTFEEVAQDWATFEHISLAQARQEIADFLKEMEEEGALTISEPKFGKLPEGWAEKTEKVDVLLVVPPNPSSSREEVPVPLGVLMLAQALREHGYSVAVFDMYLDNLAPDEVRKAVRKYQPGMIGISIITASAPSSYDVVKSIRQERPTIVLLAGGIHATNCYEDILDHDITIAVRYEGIETLVEIANAVFGRGQYHGFLADVPGIAYRRKDKTIITLNRPLVRPDQLPRPARDLIELDRYPQKGAIMSSFGCNKRCRFCTVFQNPDMAYRARCVTSVIDELQSMYAMGVRTGNFVDDSFLLSSKRANALCEGILAAGLKMSFACQARVDDACRHPDVLEKMVEAGFTAIEFGVEAGNQSVLDWTGKGLRLEEALEAVKVAKRAGFIRVGCGMILGHPVDTRETIEGSIRFSLQLIEAGADNIALAICTPFPGSDIAENADQYGLKIRSRDWSRYNFREAVMDTPHLRAEEIEEFYLDGLYRIHLACK